MCYSFIVASISIIVHSKRLLWFRCIFSSPTFPIGIDVDAKTRNRVYESSFRRIVPPLTPSTLMSFIGILASLEKTVPMGRLHMKPFLWYLKISWKYLQALDIQMPCSETLKSHLIWWKECVNRLSSPCRGTPSSVIQRFICQLLGSTFGRPDIQGGTHYLEMCLIWRLITFCNPSAILLRACHIQGCVNVTAFHTGTKSCKQNGLFIPKFFRCFAKFGTNQ